MIGLGRGSPSLQGGLQRPDGPNDQQVDPVLGRQEPLHPANLGVTQQLGTRGHRIGQQPAGGSAGSDQHVWVAADALDLAGVGVGLDQ